VVALFSAVARSQDRPATIDGTSNNSSVRPDINREFRNPDLDVQQWIARFELESREIFAARREVLAACQLKRGSRVADIGAGTGLYSRLFADAVGEGGWVYAVDIAPAFVRHIAQRAEADRLANLSAVLCTERNVTLPPASVDLAFVCDTYHHFEHPQATLASIHRALSEGGRLVVVDFERIPGQSREWVVEHVRAGKAEFRAEIEAAGFAFVDEVKVEGFRENYLLRFKKQPR
jgi:predicted methyltransferase